MMGVYVSWIFTLPLIPAPVKWAGVAQIASFVLPLLCVVLMLSENYTVGIFGPVLLLFLVIETLGL